MDIVIKGLSSHPATYLSFRYWLECTIDGVHYKQQIIKNTWGASLSPNNAKVLSTHESQHKDWTEYSCCRSSSSKALHRPCPPYEAV